MLALVYVDEPVAQISYRDEPESAFFDLELLQSLTGGDQQVIHMLLGGVYHK